MPKINGKSFPYTRAGKIAAGKMEQRLQAEPKPKPKSKKKSKGK